MQFVLKDNLPFTSVVIGNNGSEVEVTNVLIDTGTDFGELSRVVTRPTFLNTVNVGWALPAVEAGISYILVGNAHPTLKKFCGDKRTGKEVKAQTGFAWSLNFSSRTA